MRERGIIFILKQNARIWDKTQDKKIVIMHFHIDDAVLQSVQGHVRCLYVTVIMANKFADPIQNYFLIDVMEKSRQDQLLDALLDRDITQFYELLKYEDVNPNHKYDKPHYSTCLEIACRHIGCDEFIRVLLKFVKPNINNIHPEPIHHAAKKGHYEAIKVLLDDKRTKVNAVDSSGRTALHFALKEFGKGEMEDSLTRSDKCVEFLLNHPDTNINSPNNKGFTPIFEAAYSGGKEAVESLLEHAKRRNRFLDLDANTHMGKTARAFIEENFPELKRKLPSNRTSGFFE